MTLLEELKFRGFIKDFTDEEGLTALLNEQKVRFYCGFDPTADSLHVGHLIPIIIMKHFQKHHHQPIAVVGGGTGLIGDPSGKKTERELLTLQKSIENSQGIQKQLERFLDFNGEDRAALCNNYDWLKDISLVEFLRDYGKNFTINYMLSKDVVASRLEQGISFTEFSYMIIQSIDFLHLYQKEHVQLQIGGSEQWGNITAGLDLIKKIEGPDAKAYGMTLQLLTKSDGTKFGKSASGALWLDANKTHPYQIYQYFYNIADEDVMKLVKIYTFLPIEEIVTLEKEFEQDKGSRKAQKVLAYEIVRLIHGKDIADQCVKMSEVLFQQTFEQLTAEELAIVLEGVNSITIHDKMSIVDALIATQLATSKREAREFLKNGAIAINGHKVNDENFMIEKSGAIDQVYTVLKRGKKLYALIKHE